MMDVADASCGQPKQAQALAPQQHRQLPPFALTRLTHAAQKRRRTAPCSLPCPSPQIEPFSTLEARIVVEQELGAPIEELFSEFSPEPIAAASLAQVGVTTMRTSGLHIRVAKFHVVSG